MIIKPVVKILKYVELEPFVHTSHIRPCIGKKKKLGLVTVWYPLRVPGRSDKNPGSEKITQSINA